MSSVQVASAWLLVVEQECGQLGNSQILQAEHEGQARHIVGPSWVVPIVWALEVEASAIDKPQASGNQAEEQS